VLGRFSRSIPPRATLRTSRSRRSTSGKLVIVIARCGVLVRELAIDDGARPLSMGTASMILYAF
jgi:hypothetical protein